jgi:hypothetical protein
MSGKNSDRIIGSTGFSQWLKNLKSPKLRHDVSHRYFQRLRRHYQHLAAWCCQAPQTAAMIDAVFGQPRHDAQTTFSIENLMATNRHSEEFLRGMASHHFLNHKSETCFKLNSSVSEITIDEFRKRGCKVSIECGTRHYVIESDVPFKNLVTKKEFKVDRSMLSGSLSFIATILFFWGLMVISRTTTLAFLVFLAIIALWIVGCHATRKWIKVMSISLLLIFGLIGTIINPGEMRGDRIGAIARDGWRSSSTSSGTSSHHGGVKKWLYSSENFGIMEHIGWYTCFIFVPLMAVRSVRNSTKRTPNQSTHSITASGGSE